MNTIAISFKPDGFAHCLWTEVLPLGELGKLEVRRASTIEFNNGTQQWEVRSSENQVMYANPSRNVCLDWEHQYFNR